MVDEILTMVNVMVALAVVIALIGIANTLALSVFERTRELGLVRAVGMTRRQLRRMVRYEAALVATFGATLGVGLGLLFGVGVVGSAPGVVRRERLDPGRPDRGRGARRRRRRGGRRLAPRPPGRTARRPRRHRHLNPPWTAGVARRALRPSRPSRIEGDHRHEHRTSTTLAQPTRDGSPLRRFFGVVAEPQSYRNLAYLLLGLPLGTSGSR